MNVQINDNAFLQYNPNKVLYILPDVRKSWDTVDKMLFVDISDGVPDCLDHRQHGYLGESSFILVKRF